MKKGLNIKPSEEVQVNSVKDHLREYPLYPDSDDIYIKYTKEDDLDPEDISKVKKSTLEADSDFDDEFDSDGPGDDLDIPGSELDDDQEIIGNEDEENNYYSLGGDDHNDLDEDKDDM
jgi:hypothetical protein